MRQTSQAWREAIVGSPRYMELAAKVGLFDPDEVILPVTSSPEALWSRSEQLHDERIDDPARYATLEGNRWLLDRSFELFPDDYSVPGDMGYASAELSGPEGQLEGAFVQLNFTGVSILQACSVVFDGDPVDGVPTDFTVDVLAGGVSFYSRKFTGNVQRQASLSGFRVYNPDAIRITVERWSLPLRRVRLVEIFSGYFERWIPDNLAAFTATLQGQFSCLSQPYGSVRVSIDNADRRYEPRKKDSIFQSIEERQGVDIYLGCETANGMEWLRLGVFYLAGDGWKASSNEITISWYLVDIIGLLSERTFIVPDTLPTTLSGWLQALVSQLGPNFSSRWHADPAYADRPVEANSREDVTNKKCKDILRWICQASGTWPRARQEDGHLTAEPLWNQGNRYDLDNLEAYPEVKANRSLAALIFRLADENNTEYVVSGNAASSEDTVTIANPFLHTRDQALAAARLILSQYGGNILELTGRGDPSSEIGDVDTVWLDESAAVAARRMSQTFQFQDGVMQGCRSTLLQADGSYLYTEFAIMDADDGVFAAVDGVTEYRLVLSDGGQGGGLGEDGFVRGEGVLPGHDVAAGFGDPGPDGSGGRVWFGVIHLNPGQIVPYHRGRGGTPSIQPGEPGEAGEPSTFGVYSSANGTVYPNGYTDIANGQTFCRAGVAAPLPGSGDGGAGGAGGDPGQGYWRQLFWPDGRPRGWEFVITQAPGKGKPGVPGASGFIMVSWDKPKG